MTSRCLRLRNREDIVGSDALKASAMKCADDAHDHDVRRPAIAPCLEIGNGRDRFAGFTGQPTLGPAEQFARLRQCHLGHVRNNTDLSVTYQAENAVSQQIITNCSDISDLCIASDISAPYASVVFHEGDVLRKWREERGWTVVQLAKKSGVDKNTVTRAEKNQTTRTDTLRVITTALGHTMEELHRALNPSGQQLLPGELEHLARWRRLSSEARERINGLIRLADEYERRLRDENDERGKR